MQKSPANPGSASHNVYCGYLEGHHNILGKRRIMCSPLIGADCTRFSNPHQLSWSQLQARANPKEPFFDAVIGGVALAMLLVAMAFV